jgi:hypothetical protein
MLLYVDVNLSIELRYARAVHACAYLLLDVT